MIDRQPEHLDELIERRWRELGWDGKPFKRSWRDRWENLLDASGEIACCLLAIACLFQAIALIARMLQ